jgi:predicted enzyme related to lactoylglutathione lyase
MPQLDAPTPGAPCWADLFTSDTTKAEDFYGGLFGWTAASAGEEYGGYINFSLNGQMVAGGMRNDRSTGTPDAWSVYLSTDDAASTAAAVTAHGGAVVVPAMQVMDLGSMAVFTDAGGAAIGAWQAGTHKGFGVRDAPGAPAWFELHTRDYARMVQFYRDVFHWDTHVTGDTDEFRYTTLGQGEARKAGIMDVSRFPADLFPVAWSVYFEVEDADATAAKATKLGGTVLQAPEDTPYGRLATLADPTGARFKIVAR